MTDGLEETDLTQRLVLLGLVRADDSDETPIAPNQLRRTCEACLDDADAPNIGRVTEADVTRTLKELAATDFVDEAVHDQSAVGKGRPVFSLAGEREAVLDELATDDRLAPAVPEGRD